MSAEANLRTEELSLSTEWRVMTAWLDWREEQDPSPRGLPTVKVARLASVCRSRSIVETKQAGAEEYLTIEELAARLQVYPKFVRDLLSEMASQVTREYLTIEELAKRLSWEQRTVKNKMAAGIFQKGIHYFSPKGIRPRFKWSAIVAWLEERDRQAKERQPTTNTAPAKEAIPMARGYLLGERSHKKLADRS